MQWFCKHEWAVIHRGLMPSRVDMLRRLEGLKCQAFPLDIGEITTVKGTLVLACKKCGKLKTVGISN